jgi:hypothetical protein
MRARGVTYDTGFVNAGTTTRTEFDPDVVRRELRIIRDDLHCTAVRPTGGDRDRLEVASRIAAEFGLEVWYSPFTCDLTPAELLDFLTDGAERAERIRRSGGEVVFVTGAEITFATAGFLPGATIIDRIKYLTRLFEFEELSADASRMLNDFLATAVAKVRARFGGRIGYASVWAERVDWTPFDFVGVDAYRSAVTRDRYPDAVRALASLGKPLAITEFGSATYRGSAAKGVHAEDIVVWEGANPDRLDADVERDESEQAQAISEMYSIFAAAGVDTCFAHTFGFWHMVHRDDPRRDLDRAGYGIVRPLDGRHGARYPDMTWEPKQAFDALAALYGKQT